MLRERSAEEYGDLSAAGVRHLFRIGGYRFEDVVDGEGVLHHIIGEDGAGPGGSACTYEVDRDTMYEFAARYLAGLYELEKYELDESPGHVELLDVLEIATARARGGEFDFSWEEFDAADAELIGEGEDEDGDEEADGVEEERA
jgi:hypothetical protein